MERTRVIIADDEALIRMDLREMLTNLGYLVVGEVADGRSAVNQARELRPDVVVMDIKMPDMDGIEAAQVLTEERIAPTVLLSAYGQRELVERAREAGAEALVTACPLCQVNIEMRQVQDPKMPAFYITELLGLAFGLPEAQKWWSKHLIDPRPVLSRMRLVERVG